MIRVFTLIFALFAILATGAESLNTWQKQMPITFSGYTPPGNETLTNFPALVILSNTTAGAGFAYGDFLSPPYADLRFAAGDKTTPLNFEIEKWDTNGNSYVWLQVPALAGTNTQIWAFWGKRDINAPPCTTNGAVWTEGFAGVWHMNQINAQDSTSNANHGVAFGTVTNAAGRVDGADGFDGSTGYVNCGNKASLNLTNSITIEAWVMRSSGPTYPRIAQKGNANTGYGLIFEDITLKARLNLAGDLVFTLQSNFPYDTWKNVAMTYNSHYVRGFVDGVATYASSDQNKPISSTADSLQIGRRGDAFSSTFIKGILDELRISSVARSSDWIWACYMNAASNNVFNTHGEITLSNVNGTIIYAW